MPGTDVQPEQQRRHEQELFLLGQRQRGGARHSGAPMLRRNAIKPGNLEQ
jgi:hypothetical protein